MTEDNTITLSLNNFYFLYFSATNITATLYSLDLQYLSDSAWNKGLSSELLLCLIVPFLLDETLLK